MLGRGLFGEFIAIARLSSSDKYPPLFAFVFALAFDELMGNEVDARKKWIMANAHKAELDT